MSRNIIIYGVNHNLLRKSFPANYLLNENPDPLINKMYEVNDADPQQFVDRVMNHTEQLSPLEISCLTLFYEDSSLRKMIRQNGGPGAVLLFDIPVTNASCVFMEQFLEFAIKYDVPQEDQNYLLNKGEIERFLDWIINLTFIFSGPGDRELKKFLAKNKYREELLETLEREEKRREELKERYTEKWGTDYFAFADYYDRFIKLKNTINNSDRFLITDSF